MSVTPSSPVVGVFTDRSMAEQAVGALYNAGFEHEQIRYSVPGTSGSFFEGLKSLFTGTSPNGDDLANDLTSMGLSDEEARYYSNEFRNGNIILAVQARGREQEALSVLHQYSAYNSHDVFNQATEYAQQPSDSTQQANYGTPQPQNSAQNWQTQPPFGTSAEPPFDDREQDIVTPEHETDYQAPQTNGTTPEQEAASQNAFSGATGEKAENWTAQSDMSAPDRDVEAQSPQANAAVTSEQIDGFHRLQEQLRAAQQQLQEAKTQLQAAKEREQQFQTMKQQLQEVQSELEATLAELRETQARLAQYQ